MFGGLRQNKAGKVEVCDEVYTLRLANKECNWTKQGEKWGDNGPLSRSQHTAVAFTDKLWVFGGHFTPQVRLNDVWIYDTKNNSWFQPPWQDKITPTNNKTTGGGPCPRANSAAVIYGNKVYLFGGHGGY
jgi:tRNA wybutosine-synthesizing protein 3